MKRTGICLFATMVVAGCIHKEAAWNPASSDLVFSSNRSGNSEIYLLRTGDSTWTNLTNDPAPENWPVWSPDGKRIAYQKWVDGKLDIWVMMADGSEKTRLTVDPDHDYLPSWTPDGSQITFASWRTEAGDTGRTNHIYIMNADGSGQRRWMASSPGTSTSPSWSPDGSMFAMNAKVPDGRSEIFLFDKDGTTRRRLTTGDTTSFGSPEFSPDGTSIVFYADNGTTSALWISDLEGNIRKRLLEAGQNWYGRWSPDGTWLVFTTSASATESNDLDIMAIPVEEGGPPLLLAGGPGRESEASWRPPGNER